MDKTPNGFGEFGHDATNPIPFRDIESNLVYFDVLKTATGQPIKYKKLGSVKVENIKKSIDSYEITTQGEVIAILYVSPYQEHNSRKAPEGFVL